MAQDNELTLLNGEKKKKAQAGLPIPLPKIRELTKEAFRAFLGHMFDSVDDALFEMADRARSNNEQTYFFDSMREVRIQRKSIENSFQSLLEANFVALHAPAKKRDAKSEETADLESLSLVQKDTFELSVAITGMVTKARGGLTAELFSINTRMDSLFRHKVDHRNNPLDPQLICDAFEKACEKLDVDVECKLLIFKQFERYVLDRLKELLSDVEKVLVKAGISPKAKFKRKIVNRPSVGPKKGDQSDTSLEEGVLPQDGMMGDQFVQGPQGPVMGGPATGTQGSSSIPVNPYSAAPGSAGASEGFQHGQAYDSGAGLSAGSPGYSYGSALYGANPVLNDPGHTQGTDYESPHVASNKELFSMLQGLLSTNPQHNRDPIISTAQVSGSGPAHIVGRDELMDMLSSIQGEQADVSQELENPSLNVRQVLSGLLNDYASDDKKARVSPFDEDVIDLVAMFFDFILDDPNLPTDIQALIGRLQIPILRLAIKDRAFFNKPAHPARLLLNELARAGVGLEEGAKGRKDVVYEKISSTVKRILKEFDMEIELFEVLHIDFKNFLESEAKRSQKIEKKTQETEVGKAKTDQARALVQRMVEDRISGQRIPEVLLPLFNDTWSQVMFRIGIKEGPESEGWYNAVEALDNLVWTLVPRRDYKSRQRWSKTLPMVFEQVRKGLEDLNYNPFEQQRILAELEQSYREILRASLNNEGLPLAEASASKELSVVELSEKIEEEVQELESVVTEQDRISSMVPADEFDTLLAMESKPHAERANTAHKTAVEIQREKERVELQEFMEKADGIPVGTWLVFTPAAGARLSCKLSAKIKDNNTFIFVNRRGQKVLEQKKKLVAQELRRGRIKIIDSRPLFDRALDTIIGKLSGSSNAVNKPLAG